VRIYPAFLAHAAAHALPLTGKVMMFAINHAAAALPLKRFFPGVPLIPLLISVQLLEVLWVGLNYLGVERTATEPVVTSVVDVHLAHMPFSHSIASALVIAAGLGLVLWRRSKLMGWAVAIGILSHLVLDLITHSPDIALAPFVNGPEFGLGAWTIPAVGLATETVWGVLCWAIFGGTWWLLGAILAFNAANVSFLFPQISGPEGMLAGRPTLAVTLVLVQILLTWLVIWLLARERGSRLQNYGAIAE
jgi:membrane-bound metal-dependent hydrolase YbcI (DUF457 family)